MVGVALKRGLRGAMAAFALALAPACAHEDVEPPPDSDPVEPEVGAIDPEEGAGECVLVEEEGVEGFDYLASSPDGAIRIELRESEFGHKMVRVVEQRPDGSTLDLRYRSPEEELVIVESVRGEDPVRTVLTGEEAMASEDAAWIGDLLTQARAVCGQRSTGP